MRNVPRTPISGLPDCGASRAGVLGKMSIQNLLDLIVKLYGGGTVRTPPGTHHNVINTKN